MPTETRSLFTTTPRGLAPLLANELRDLGASDIRPVQSGVHFSGDRALAYRACLWLRTGGRVLLRLSECEADTPDMLYSGIRQIAWAEHLMPEGALAVSCATAQSKITHTRYAAQKVKDAIVDQFRDQFNVRPSVDIERPDLRINVHLFRDRATVSLDLSGASLHQRGYRTEGLDAPLKEHLAAALLLRARWPEIAQNGGPFLDPMCGSGTLPIEAALIAADIAPGLRRNHFGFENWLQHDAFLWRDILDDAWKRRDAGIKQVPVIVGSDNDPNAIAIARENADRAGVSDIITFEQRHVKHILPPEGLPGLLVTNPPYGERLGKDPSVGRAYTQLGEAIRQSFPGWRVAVFTGNPALAPRLKLKPRRTYSFFNGALPCKLMVYKLGDADRGFSTHSNAR